MHRSGIGSRLAGLVGGLLFSLPALAIAAPPAGWVKVETYGFTTYLPKDWREFSNKKPDPENKPNLGSWAFMSPHASRKVWIRVSELQKGSLAEAVKRSVAHMLKNVTEHKKLKELPLEKDETKRDGVVVFYKGFVDAMSHSKKILQSYEHLIMRGIVRMPDLGIQVAVTHMYRGNKLDKAEEFFLEHLENTTPRSLKEALKLKNGK